MHKYRALLLAALLVAGTVSLANAHPLTNIAIDDNEGGWFTFDNLEDYGEDLDARASSTVTVFTGHPAYVMGSDNARLWDDMPRVHYFAITFEHTRLGRQMYADITRDFRSGRVDYVIAGPMTEGVLTYNQTAADAFVANYCLVDDRETMALYNRTNSRLYAHTDGECPPDRRPNRTRFQPE